MTDEVDGFLDRHSEPNRLPEHDRGGLSRLTVTSRSPASYLRSRAVAETKLRPGSESGKQMAMVGYSKLFRLWGDISSARAQPRLSVVVPRLGRRQRTSSRSFTARATVRFLLRSHVRQRRIRS